MFRLWLPLVLFFFVQSSQAVEFNESFVCSPQMISINFIVCCDTLPEQFCKQTLDTVVTPEQNDFLTQLTADILAYPKEVKPVVNSFRAALELTGTHLPNPFTPLGLNDFEAALGSYYVEVFNPNDMQIGDLLVFDERGEYLKFIESPMETSKTAWEKGHEVIHAMVYVGGGLVLQKENVETAVSSISSLERALIQYNAYSQSTIKTADYRDKKTTLVVRIFRKFY